MTTHRLPKLAPCLLLLGLLTLMCLCPVPSQSLRILGMFPMNGRSHFVLSEALMRALAARGHQVDVYSHFPLKQKIANYTDYSLAGTAPILTNNMTYEMAHSLSHGVSLPKIMELVGYPVCQILESPIMQRLIRDPPRDPPYDIVIVEPFVSDCHLAWGHHLKVPTVVLITMTTLFDWMYETRGNPLSLASDAGNFARSSPPMNFFNRLDNVVRHHAFKWLYYYYLLDQDALLKKNFGTDMPSPMELSKETALVLVNHNHALNGARTFVPSVVPVGGMHVIDNAENLSKRVQKFLDESKNGFIYFSFGSMIRIETFPKSTLNDIYKTFRKIAPVRVLIKVAKPDELPPNLPSNVLTDSWLPQIKVLKHKNIRAFITHGGLMGTLESIYNGVPLIGFPVFGDQYFNIESYSKKNLAIRLDYRNLTEESFTGAILEILNNPIYAQSAKETGILFRDLPMPPIETAIFWIEYVARHGPNKLRTIGVDLPWWQVSLLDVYAFLAALVILALFVLKVILKTFVKLICAKKRGDADVKTKKS